MRGIDRNAPGQLDIRNGTFRMPLDAPITRLGLPPRIVVKLEAVGIVAISDLAKLSESDITTIAGIKGASLATIVECMRESGVESSAMDTIPKAMDTMPKKRRGRPVKAAKANDLQSTPGLSRVETLREDDSLVAAGEHETDASTFEIEEVRTEEEGTTHALRSIASEGDELETLDTRQKRVHPKDDERASRYAARKQMSYAPAPAAEQIKDDSLGTSIVSAPRVALDEDERVAMLRRSSTMDVEDAAFLYRVPKEQIYAACRRGEIPHRRFGMRIKVLTRPVFAELGL